MKWLAALIAGVVVLSVLLIGLQGAAWFASDDAACSESGTCGTSEAWAAQPFIGADGYIDDPTSNGFISLRMLHIYNEIEKRFGWQWGVSCWDEHAWNPSSDHPRGRACDYTVGEIGRFAGAVDRAKGWELARWLQENAAPLGVSYVIFDGRIWSLSRQTEGWRSYDGGGVYDAEEPTGGHFDHLHVSSSATTTNVGRV